jgi:hypothetical protein
LWAALMNELTRIPANLAQGDARAAKPLLSHVSEELRTLAARSAASAGPSTTVTAGRSIKVGSSDV